MERYAFISSSEVCLAVACNFVHGNVLEDNGRAYPYSGLDHLKWEEERAPYESVRTQFWRIAIANTGFPAISLKDAAYDASWRAVQEQTSKKDS
jgi:hypothetical protein